MSDIQKLQEEVFCEKHGKITENALYFSYVDTSVEPPIAKKHYYCLQCLANLLDNFIKQGILPKVNVQ